MKRPLRPKITREWLDAHYACDLGRDTFCARFPEGATIKQTLAWLQRERKISWAGWLIHRLLRDKVPLLAPSDNARHWHYGRIKLPRHTETVQHTVICVDFEAEIHVGYYLWAYTVRAMRLVCNHVHVFEKLHGEPDIIADVVSAGEIEAANVTCTRFHTRGGSCESLKCLIYDCSDPIPLKVKTLLLGKFS